MMRSSFILIVLFVSFISFFSSSASASSSRSTNVRVALIQPNVDGLIAALDSVSSPSSPLYGQHLSAADVASFVGTSPSDIDNIIDWIVTHPDIRAEPSSIKVSATGDYIDMRVSADVAAEMVGDAGQRQRMSSLSASSLTQHRGLGGRFKSHTLSQSHVSFAFHAPESVDDILPSSSSSSSQLEFVHLDRLPSRAERQSRFADSYAAMKASEELASQSNQHSVIASEFGAVRAAQLVTDGTPANQRAAYGVPASLVATSPKNLQEVWGTGTYGFAQSDLSQYYSSMNIAASEINLLNVTGFAGQPGGDNFGEGTLDVSLISAVAPGVQTSVSNTDTSSSSEEGDGFGPAMLLWLTTIVDSSLVTPLPKVISISLGSLSWDSCNLLCDGVATAAGSSTSYAQCQSYMQSQRQVCMYPDSDGMDRMNIEYAKLGAMGVSVMAATGDGGSHFSFQFFNNDPIGAALNTVACQFNFPTFPAESPYVTGVGGTDWTAGGSSAPVAWSASGGGFSWRYPQPSYQQSAVQNYYKVANPLPPLSAFNSSNRGYPDVAALATNVPIVMAGSLQGSGGTSASAPSFSALISLINDARLNAGLSSLGFINPTLYALAGKSSSIYAEIFYDMSSGNSDCDSSGNCCNVGTAFQAATGWDPTTGLGSPLFGGLLKYLGTNAFLEMFQ